MGADITRMEVTAVALEVMVEEGVAVVASERRIGRMTTATRSLGLAAFLDKVESQEIWLL